MNRRRHDRMRLDEAPPPDAAARAARRIGEREREAAAAALARAQRDGRFGASDLYERRMEVVLAARTQADLDRIVGDLEELVPARVRTRMLRVIARARADGRLDFDEFCERTDRCLEPLARAHADGLVGDLGFRVVRPVRRRPAWEPAARKVVLTGLAGGAVGTALVAVPTALDLPGGVGQWLPLAVGTGVFSAVGTAIAAVAWTVRGADARAALVRQRPVPGAGPGTRRTPGAGPGTRRTPGAGPGPLPHRPPTPGRRSTPGRPRRP